MESEEINVQLLILVNNEVIISKIEEVAALDIGDPNCKLISPYKVEEKDKISPWLSDLTDDDVIMICSDKILTLVEPHKSLTDLYLQRATTSE
tara:strand:- start:1074 stop:1352 length:279 start_codon:yes stop_codon:yes gene_type:complete